MFDWLVGKKATLGIGEPWDFESADGQNRLEAEIYKVISDSSQRPSIFLKTTPFANKGVQIQYLVGQNRNSLSYQSVKEDLESGEWMTMNFGFKLDGRELTEDEIKYSRHRWENGSHLIGCILLNEFLAGNAVARKCGFTDD